MVEIQHMKSTVLCLEPSPEQKLGNNFFQKTGEWGENTGERQTAKIKRGQKNVVYHITCLRMFKIVIFVHTICTYFVYLTTPPELYRICAQKSAQSWKPESLECFYTFPDFTEKAGCSPILEILKF